MQWHGTKKNSSSPNRQSFSAFAQQAFAAHEARPSLRRNPALTSERNALRAWVEAAGASFWRGSNSLPGIPRTAWRRFAGTLRSPQIKMRFAHGWRQPELHFGEARTRFPASHEPPGGASREPCAHLRSKCASRMGGGSEFEKPVSIAKNNTTTMSWCYFLERATRLELATSTLARWRSTR